MLIGHAKLKGTFYLAILQPLLALLLISGCPRFLSPLLLPPLILFVFLKFLCRSLFS